MRTVFKTAQKIKKDKQKPILTNKIKENGVFKLYKKSK